MTYKITWLQDYERAGGDALQANHIEDLRYQAAMQLENEMLNIREILRMKLTEKTPLKTEEVFLIKISWFDIEN